MNINEASEHLRRLAQNNPHRSKTGHLRELYMEIEAARKAGVATEKIVDALNEKGLDISLGTFVTLLHRIRKELGKVSPVSAGYSTNRRVSDFKARIEPIPASQEVVNGSDEKKYEGKSPEQSATASRARGVRIKKVECETSKEFAANFVAKNSNKSII